MIDSNQTRYHLLLGKDDWARCDQDGGASVFALDAQGSEVFSWNTRSELTLGARANFFHSAPGNIPPVFAQRRGAGQDRFGNWYWIGPSKTELLVTSCGTGVTTHFWTSTDECELTCPPASGFAPVQPVTPRKPLIFSGLAVTTEHYLVVGVLEPAGLVVFDLFHGGPPRQFTWPKSIPFLPFDMAPAPNGGVWILDRQNRRYWALDRTFSVIRQDQTDVPLGQNTDVFVPLDGTAPAKPKPTFPSGITLGLSSPINAFDPIAIEALPDNSVLFLESDPSQQFSRIHRYRFGAELGIPVSLDLVLSVILPSDRAGFSLLGFDFAFIGTETLPEGTRKNTLYIVAQSGDQAWAFQADFSADQLALRTIPEYRPMRLFSGMGIVAGQAQVFYDSQNRWIPLVMQRRPRYVESAALVSPVFDAKEPDSVWHRLMLDAVLPTDTAIRVFTRAGNGEAELSTAPWNEEPAPYRRSTGIELPWTNLPACLGTWETLFQNATGRYLQIKLLLSGNGRTSPAIYALRAYYPRFSYLKSYLPAVYRQDASSASFLDRFLANFEGMLTTIEDKIATVQALLDPASSPAEVLDWLANWFGVGLDPAWTETKRRLFLKNAATFFEARGTLPGLMMALRLTLDDCVSSATFSAPLSDPGGPRIVEKFRTRNVPMGMHRTAAATFGLPLELKASMWTPSQGAEELDQRYRTSVSLSGAERYPLSLPASDGNYEAWSKFSQGTLGFRPAAPATLDVWTLFLRNQYRVISLLNAAYHASYGSFEDVPFPQALPRQTSPLSDWYQFQGLLLVRSSAHQFTIFLPMPLGGAQDVSAQRAKVQLARRVVELEKPAHTEFDIQFFWAFFRLGETRLGKETLLDQSSRAPQLLRPALLGDTYIGSSYVSRSEPGQPRWRHLLESGADNATLCRTRNCEGGQA